MFKIIKKGSGNFWHNFNNGSKEVNLSDWEIVLDSVNQTVSLQMLNGANIPNNSVIISDVVVIDETDGSIEETFGSVSILRTRLIELNYTPYIVLNGFVPEAPIDGLTYGRKDAEWVEVSGGGGSTPDATTTVKGKLKLAGDLAGTADLPTVPNKVDKNTAISAATKTKITYDSKGLVTEGADALTSDITDSVNRRYVTDAQLVVIGNTSGTNTGDQDLSALESKTVQTTGSVISFSTRQRYNSIASPTSENITDNLTGARIGVVQKIFSNRGTTPTFPSGWVKRGAGNYIPSTLNIIYAEWEEGTTVSYWITQ